MSGKIFEQVQIETPNRNSFDLTHDYKTTLDMGELVPCCIIECLPGGNYTLGSQSLWRFAPMIAPTMQRYDARIEYYFVPNRIVWPNWNNFISSDPGNLPNIPAFPTIDINAARWNDVCDWMGIPKPIGGFTEAVNAIPFAALQMIYEWYYRDQNLTTANQLGSTLRDGDNTLWVADITRKNYRAWEHDMYTSCLPFAQKGLPVTIGSSTFQDVPVLMDNSVAGTAQIDTTFQPGAGTHVLVDTGVSLGPDAVPQDHLYADTSLLDAFSLTINDLREAEALQKWLEKNARGGTRPDEIIKAHFGVDTGDARIQKPEYIVGVKQPVMVSEVLNTAGLEISGSGSPQGNMAGHGLAAINDENYGSYRAVEHGFIIGIMSILPKTSYTQGLEKFWLKTKDATDYYWPDFAHLGEQPVTNREVYAFTATGDDTFGYLPAFQDYRYKQSITTGDFRDSLAFWTAARIFSSQPALNSDFVVANQVSKDIFAVTDPNIKNIYVHIINKVYANLPVPVYGTPSLV